MPGKMPAGSLAAQLALQGSMRARTLGRSREVSFANLTTQLKNVIPGATRKRHQVLSFPVPLV